MVNFIIKVIAVLVALLQREAGKLEREAGSLANQASQLRAKASDLDSQKTEAMQASQRADRFAAKLNNLTK